MGIGKWKFGVFVILLSLSCGQGVSAQKWDSREVAQQKYESYKVRVVAGDLAVDWRAFRIASALAETPWAFDWQSARSEVQADLTKKQYEDALRIAQTVIDHNMAFGEGHLLKMTALEKMGRKQEADSELAILTAIGKSITDSGDGLSEATAWFTVLPSESMFFLRDALGATFVGQELVEENGHAYDKLRVTDRTGKPRVIWFNTDINELLKYRGKHSGVSM
jgi:hypothetical protein